MGNVELSERVIGCAIEVHRHLGPGLLESVYEDCLVFELDQARPASRRQVDMPVVYKGVRLSVGYRLDILVEEQLVLEIKSVERVLPVHEPQLLTYLRMSGLRAGLVLNFNHVTLKEGIRRVVA